MLAIAASIAMVFDSTTALGQSIIDPSTRAASQLYFHSAYEVPGVPIGWTGDFVTCDPGATSLAFRQSVIGRINYFRAMAGVPPVALNDARSAMAQDAALMTSANSQVNHSPPPSWQCYTLDGATAAANSNLAYGTNGAAAVNLYMQDPAPFNAAVAHRRLLLNPAVNDMGTGDVPRATPYAPANAIWVLDDTPAVPRPATREPFVAWPPPGFVPYQATYARWSFSYPAADFSAATVMMNQNGAPVALVQEAIVSGYGDNSLVWIPKGLSDFASWPQPTADESYDVTIDNVLIGGSPQSFSYEVTIFDANVITGDVNNDKRVDAVDLTAWKNNFGAQQAVLNQGDADRDADVDGADFLQWQQMSGFNLATAAMPAPEPNSLVAAGILAAILAIRSRRCARPPTPC
jgi:uncharacterized protein YkwD